MPEQEKEVRAALTVRFSQMLRRELAEAAAREDRSLNSEITNRLKRSLAHEASAA